jgi:hypothetical protein
MRAEELENLTADLLENLTAEALVAEANKRFAQANKENTNLAGGHERRLLLHLEAQFCLTTAARKRADAEGEQNRKREYRRFLIELILELVIVGLIGWEIWEGRQQAKVLERVDTSAFATAAAMKEAADAQAASLHVLQEERAERARKPRLALYLGNIPLDKAFVRVKPRAGTNQTMAVQDVLLKNEGDAPASTFRLHIVVPGDVIFNADPLMTVPEYEPSASPNSHRVTLQIPLLPAGQTVRIHTEVYVPKGRPAFTIPFTADALELRAVLSLGSLKVIPLAI